MTEQETLPPPAPVVERRRRPWREVASVGGVVVAAGAALGALGGWLWYHWWAPANTGTIYDTTLGVRWFDITDHGITHQFDGPAQYAVIALGLGALLGSAAALLGHRQALAALGGLVLGSALAAYASWAVGTALSPPDPEEFATKANIGKEYPAALELSGWTPLLCWPLGALAAFCLTIAVRSTIREFRRQQVGQQEAGNWLQPAPTADRSGQSPLT